MKTQTNKIHRGAQRRAPTARTLMTADPETVMTETHLVTAAAKMAELGLRHLPVVDEDGRLVGMISDRDVRMALGNPGDALRTGRLAEVEELTVGTAMTNDAISVDLDAPARLIAETLAVERIGAVPVIDEGEHVVGIVSYVDLLAYFARKEDA